MEDRELLREFIEQKSEAAFAELVARHVNLVYAAALRVVREPAMAQDVAQTVFIQLARKAWMLREGNALVGWLYRAAYRAAVDAVRGDQRRRQRETEAMNLSEQNADDTAVWAQLAPLLDEAMQKLNRVEQNALLLHYFEGKTMREAGEALGVSGPAVQMRVGRALEKLRAHFARSGVTVATGMLGAMLSLHSSKAAPVDLAARVTGSSLAGVAGAGLGSALFTVFFMNTKTKIGVAAVIVVALTATFLVYLQRKPASAPPNSSMSTASNADSASTRPQAAAAIPRVPGRVQAPVVAAVNTTSAEIPRPSAATPSSSGGSSEPKAELRSDLKTLIPEAIRLFHTRDYVSFVKILIPPGELSKMPPGTTYEQLAKHAFVDDQRAVEQMSLLLEALQTVQDQTPKMDANGENASYTLNPPLGDHKAITFIKVDGLWYLEE